MKKPILYCDCDGVIFNTIQVAFEMMCKLGYDIHNPQHRDYFFQKYAKWDEIFEQAEIIDNSIEKIKKLKNSKDFSDVMILTKISGGYPEEKAKVERFNRFLPNTKIITLEYGVSKESVVDRSEDHILVDDEKRNCASWHNHNDGTAILFSQKAVDLENNIVNDLLAVPYTEGYKKLIKTRYF